MALPEFTMRQLLEAGIHFGHQTRRWDPKMGPYIFGVRNGVHILDLQQTVPMLHQALGALRDVAAGGAFGQAAAHDDVLDLVRIDPSALDRVLDRMAAKLRAMGVVEGAPVGLGDGRAGGRYDNGVVHCPVSPFLTIGH